MCVRYIHDTLDLSCIYTYTYIYIYIQHSLPVFNVCVLYVCMYISGILWNVMPEIEYIIIIVIYYHYYKIKY